MLTDTIFCHFLYLFLPSLFSSSSLSQGFYHLSSRRYFKLLCHMCGLGIVWYTLGICKQKAEAWEAVYTILIHCTTPCLGHKILFLLFHSLLSWRGHHSPSPPLHPAPPSFSHTNLSPPLSSLFLHPTPLLSSPPHPSLL